MTKGAVHADPYNIKRADVFEGRRATKLYACIQSLLVLNRSAGERRLTYGLTNGCMCCCAVYILTGITVPGKPGRPVVNKVSATKVTITWAPPVSDDGCKIIKYFVKYYDSSELDLESRVEPKTAGSSTSCTFSKRLAASKTFKFAVAAENEYGIGPLSEFSEFIKTPTREGRNVVLFCE